MKKYGSIFALCLLLIGCSSVPLQRQDFLLSATYTTSAQALNKPRFSSLQVSELRANRPYNSLALIYRESPQRYVLDPYHGFLATPAQQISAITRDSLARSGLFSAVLPQGSSLLSQWRLEGELQAFYINVSNPAKPNVTLEIRYALSQEASQTATVWRLATTEPILDASPEQAVIGFNRALNTLLLQLEASLLAAQPLE